MVDSHISVAFDETTSADDVRGLWTILNVGKDPELDPAALAAELGDAGFGIHRRTSAFLTHPVFNTHHTETEMLRYIRRLEARDLSLTTSMIPLGSCTMKLNATSEMLPVTWPEFGTLHPYCSEEHVQGYLEMCSQLEKWLARDHRFRVR